MTPTIGRIVHYRLTAEQAEQVNRRRSPPNGVGALDANGNRLWCDGAQRHVGSYVGEGSVVPLIITAVWPEEYAGSAHLSHHEAGQYQSAFGVNGQAILDGSDTLWVCSAPQSETLTGCWFWPPRS